jgi:hypothetical protein
VLYREPRKGSSFKKRGTVTAIREGGRSYVLETSSGTSTIRNNKYMRMNTVDTLPEEGATEGALQVSGSAVTRAIFELRAPEMEERCIVISKYSRRRGKAEARRSSAPRREHARMVTDDRRSLSEERDCSVSSEKPLVSWRSGPVHSESKWGYVQLLLPRVVTHGTQAVSAGPGGPGLHEVVAGHEVDLDRFSPDRGPHCDGNEGRGDDDALGVCGTGRLRPVEDADEKSQTAGAGTEAPEQDGDEAQLRPEVGGRAGHGAEGTTGAASGSCVRCNEATECGFCTKSVRPAAQD